jgi:hypothetical protein
LADHYQKVLERLREIKTELNKLNSKGKSPIPSDVFDPATVRAIIDFLD